MGKVKVFLTKYALTKGIIEVEGEITNSGSLIYGSHSYAHSSEFYTAKEYAIPKAEDMRRRKLASLKKKIALLESMDFTKADPFSKGGE